MFVTPENISTDKKRDRSETPTELSPDEKRTKESEPTPPPPPFNKQAMDEAQIEADGSLKGTPPWIKLFAEMKEINGKVTNLSSLGPKVDGVATKVTNLKASVDYLSSQVTVLQKDNTKLKSALAKSDLKITALEMKNNKLNKEVSDLKEETLRLDTAQRKCNLIFTGVPEPYGGKEDMFRTIYQVFEQKMGLETGYINVSACYRLGSKKTYQAHSPKPPPRALLWCASIR